MDRKIVRGLLISLALMLLSSCNLIDKVNPPVVWTPTVVDMLQVVVAQTLTAMPTQGSVIEVLTPEVTATPMPEPTATLEPTPDPTATVQATLQATPTAVPAGVVDVITGEPGSHFLHIYFDEVLREDYAAAWNNLTPAYRQNKHKNLLSDFTEGYEKMNLCDIEISDVQVLTHTASYVKLAAHFVYKTGAACTAYPYDFDAHFNYDTAQQRWLLDGLTNRK